MCLSKCSHRGFEIHKNLSDDFKTNYYSTANDFIHTHVHGVTFSEIKDIINCYWDVYNNRYFKIKKYSLRVRQKAMRLMGYKVNFA